MAVAGADGDRMVDAPYERRVMAVEFDSVAQRQLWDRARPFEARADFIWSA
jgi:hypothetical protein